MKQIIHSTSLVALLLLAVGSVSAQTLSSLIDQALRQNYQLSITRNDAQLAKNNNTLGNAGYLPQLSVEGGYNVAYNNTRQEFADGSVREGNNAQNTSLTAAAMLNWPVFNGFSVKARHTQLGYLEQLGQVEAKFYIEQTVADVVTSYYQLVYEKRLLEQYTQAMNTSKMRLHIATEKRKIGASNAVEYGQALVAYQTDSMQTIAQHNAITSLEIELNRIINADLEKPLSIENTSFELLPLSSKEALLEKVKESSTALEQQKLQELIAETDLRITEAQRYPTVSLFAGYQYNVTQAEVGFFSSNQNYGPIIGVNVRFNLYNGGNVNREVKNYKLQQQNTLLLKDQVHNNLNASVLTALNNYYGLKEQITIAESNVTAMNKVFNTAQAQLKQGAINGYDYRLTQQSLLDAQQTLARLEYNAKAIEITLHRLSSSIIEAYK